MSTKCPDFTSAQESLFLTLAGRALDSHLPRPFLVDDMSDSWSFNGYTPLAVWAIKHLRMAGSLDAGAAVNPGFYDPHEPERWGAGLRLVDEIVAAGGRGALGTGGRDQLVAMVDARLAGAA